MSLQAQTIPISICPVCSFCHEPAPKCPKCPHVYEVNVLPLQRPLPEPVVFPKQALMGLKAATDAIHEAVQAPYALCANSILAATCLAVQAHADIQMPVGSPRPLSLYFLTIASSGERKSTADGMALTSIKDKEARLTEERQKLLPAWRNSLDIWTKQRHKIINSNGKQYSIDAKRVDLDALGHEPKEPLKALLTFPEPTYSGLHKYLERGQASVGVLSAEGGQFIGGHAMNQENKMETAAGFNSFWDGEPLKRIRSGDGDSALYGRRLSLHLMVQPETSLKMTTDRQLEDQGFLARFLICYPTSTQGTRVCREQSAGSIEAMHDFNDRLGIILNTKPSLKEGEDNQLEPRVLFLSPKANRLWIKFDGHLEKHRGTNGNFSRIAGLANKLPEHAARIAGVLSLYDDLNCNEVTAEHMKSGIELAQYYAQEALRLKDMQSIDKELDLAQRLFNWLKEKKYKTVPLQDIYQLAPISEIRNAKRARAIMKALEDHNYVSFIQDGAEIDGVNRKEVWRILA